MISAWLLAAVTATAGGPEGSAGADRAAYEAAAAAAGRDADSQVDLALWCEARGMPAERLKHLTRAVLLDPEDARARGLLGQVKRDGRWMRPADAVRSVEESPEQRALMGEYFERRSKAADEADDQYRLGLWCEEKGLAEPMVAHLRRAIQLDPSREGAWRRLGFKKSGRRWVHPEAAAASLEAREAQAKADKMWMPRLAKLRDALGSRDLARRAEARESLTAVDDPAAVPAIWRAFVRGGSESRQRLAAEAFGRIDGSAASAALAVLAVFSPHLPVRADAAAILQRRDPREFASLLASFLRNEVRYKVDPVEGPGSTGGLLVQGRDADVLRRYRPMEDPQLTTWPGLTPDASGVASAWPVLAGYAEMSAPIRGADLAASIAAGRAQAQEAAARGFGRFYTPEVARLMDGVIIPDMPGGEIPQDRRFAAWSVNYTAADLAKELLRDPSDANIERLGGPNFRAMHTVTAATLQVPLAAMVAEARQSTAVAREQLARDVADVEALNAPIRETNERARVVLKDVAGVDLGGDPVKWMDWAYEMEGRSYAVQAATYDAPRPTIVEDVPIAFQPQAVPSVVYSTTVAGGYVPSGISCFAGGTPVRTLQGDRPIESIRPGDMLLSQDVATGRLEYRAVVTAFHNPPNWTYAVDLGGELVHPTGIHRFWKAGHGWVMARDLRPGDRLRTVGGAVTVASVEKEKIQPVFNLLLAGGESYCVGSIGLIAHDNSLPSPVAAPFDAVPATSPLAAAPTP